GYVTRAPAPDDRRRVLVAPTAAGRTVFERLTTQIKALHRRQWAALDADELEQLIHLLNKALWSQGAEAAEPADVADASSRRAVRQPRRAGHGSR
ncbi:MAG: MarR family winged helix-turn-helix transcriptional regulator, partial [Acidimicrobiales bacterium]